MSIYELMKSILCVPSNDSMFKIVAVTACFLPLFRRLPHGIRKGFKALYEPSCLGNMKSVDVLYIRSDELVTIR